MVGEAHSSFYSKVHREEEGGQRDIETEKEIRGVEEGGRIKGECN
jgi:hypothetical protein